MLTLSQPGPGRAVRTCTARQAAPTKIERRTDACPPEVCKGTRLRELCGCEIVAPVFRAAFEDGVNLREAGVGAQPEQAVEDEV